MAALTQMCLIHKPAANSPWFAYLLIYFTGAFSCLADYKNSRKSNGLFLAPKALETAMNMLVKRGFVSSKVLKKYSIVIAQALAMGFLSLGSESQVLKGPFLKLTK